MARVKDSWSGLSRSWVRESRFVTMHPHNYHYTHFTIVCRDCTTFCPTSPANYPSYQNYPRGLARPRLSSASSTTLSPLHYWRRPCLLLPPHFLQCPPRQALILLWLRVTRPHSRHRGHTVDPSPLTSPGSWIWIASCLLLLLLLV